MPRALLILSLLAAGASARKKQSKAKPPQQHAAAAPAAGAGLSSEAPGPMRSRSSTDGDDGAAFVRHLFSTPLYVADISDSVDVDALSALAPRQHRVGCWPCGAAPPARPGRTAPE